MFVDPADRLGVTAGEAADVDATEDTDGWLSLGLIGGRGRGRCMADIDGVLLAPTGFAGNFALAGICTCGAKG